jgi:hypothetical protein
LVIKATTIDQALDAALDRGVRLLMVDKHPKRAEVIAIAAVNIRVLQRWHSEDVGYDPPYPVGALLHFSKVTKGRARKANEQTA